MQVLPTGSPRVLWFADELDRCCITITNADHSRDLVGDQNLSVIITNTWLDSHVYTVHEGVNLC